MPYNWTDQQPDERAHTTADASARQAAGRQGRAIDCGAEVEEHDGVAASRAPRGRSRSRNAEGYGDQPQAI